MITQINKFFADTLRNLGRNRLRSQLLCCSDRVLEDMGFSRELLIQGVAAWPWRVDGEHNEAMLYSIFSKHEKEIRQAINELKSYTDRELADIGIVRCDIDAIVRNGAADSATNYSRRDVNQQRPIAA